MKRTGYSRLRHRTGGWLQMPLLALALACGLFASCDTEEAGNASALPYGKYPLQLTAELVQPQTRSGIAGFGGKYISVRLGSMSTVSKYFVNENTNDFLPATAADAIYWQSTANAEVTAWYPYTDGGTVNYDISDQNRNYEFDIVRATASDCRYNEPVTLRFYHQMAMVEVKLTAGDGITAAELDGAYVTFFGDACASVTDGVVADAARYDEEIFPCEYDANKYEAVMVPQNMKGKKLVRVDIGGKTFVYTPETDAAGNLEAGKRYKYTITVKANGIEVAEATGGTWSDGGEENVAVVKVIRYTADDVKAGDYLYTDGTTSDGGLRARYSDSTAPVIADPKPQPEEGKTVAAIVFWTPADTDPTGRVTPASLTDDKIMAADFPACTHGLAVAVKELTTGMVWSSSLSLVNSFQKSTSDLAPSTSDYRSIVSGSGATDNINYILGYQNTKVLQAYNDYRKTNNKTGYIVKPVDALESFTTSNPAPLGSTGWFIPSVKELHILCHKDVDDVDSHYKMYEHHNRTIVNSSLSALTSADTINDGYYWSSSESDAIAEYSVTLYSGGKLGINKSNSSLPVRAVCAF